MTKRLSFIFAAFMLWGFITKAQPSIIDKPTEWKPNTTVLISANQQYRLSYQSDGNLVIYDKKNKAIWNTKTNGKSPIKLVFQSDGNLVMYGKNNTVFWASKTQNKGGKFFRINDLGSLSIWNDNSHIWFTGSEPSTTMVDKPVVVIPVNNDGRPGGVVKWYNAEKGYGYITPDDGGEDVFANFTEINFNGSQILKEGQRVKFTLTKGVKGMQAINISDK